MSDRAESGISACEDGGEIQKRTIILGLESTLQSATTKRRHERLTVKNTLKLKHLDHHAQRLCYEQSHKQ